FRLLPQARLVVIGAFSKRLGLIWCYGIAVSARYGIAIKKRVKEFFKAEPVLVKFDHYEPSIPQTSMGLGAS
ncbi:MAG: hypothetical protein ACXQTI_04110, partial [Candidatus Nezhaarchaeales archaeon]